MEDIGFAIQGSVPVVHIVRLLVEADVGGINQRISARHEQGCCHVTALAIGWEPLMDRCDVHPIVLPRAARHLRQLSELQRAGLVQEPSLDGDAGPLRLVAVIHQVAAEDHHPVLLDGQLHLLAHPKMFLWIELDQAAVVLDKVHHAELLARDELNCRFDKFLTHIILREVRRCDHLPLGIWRPGDGVRSRLDFEAKAIWTRLHQQHAQVGNVAITKRQSVVQQALWRVLLDQADPRVVLLP
mmetsp:Transcript_90435/g.193919  ORF Transcript_90435/g.193919 Transcript_90435/m.193919 type:complete len:242 (+) Transcript_90435:1362-2087(+)